MSTPPTSSPEPAGRDEHRVHPPGAAVGVAAGGADGAEGQHVPQIGQVRERHRRDLLGGVQVEPGSPPPRPAARRRPSAAPSRCCRPGRPAGCRGARRWGPPPRPSSPRPRPRPARRRPAGSARPRPAPAGSTPGGVPAGPTGGRPCRTGSPRRPGGRSLPRPPSAPPATPTPGRPALPSVSPPSERLSTNPSVTNRPPERAWSTCPNRFSVRSRRLARTLSPTTSAPPITAAPAAVPQQHGEVRPPVKPQRGDDEAGERHGGGAGRRGGPSV